METKNEKVINDILQSQQMAYTTSTLGPSYASILLNGITYYPNVTQTNTNNNDCNNESIDDKIKNMKETIEDEWKLAELCYDAYKGAVGGVSYNGDKLKDFNDLPNQIKFAWKESATVIHYL